MQLPAFTVPLDPNLLASLLPGVSSTGVAAGTPLTEASPPGAAFGEMFPELDSTPAQPGNVSAVPVTDAVWPAIVECTVVDATPMPGCEPDSNSERPAVLGRVEVDPVIDAPMTTSVTSTEVAATPAPKSAPKSREPASRNPTREAKNGESNSSATALELIVAPMVVPVTPPDAPIEMLPEPEEGSVLADAKQDSRSAFDAPLPKESHRVEESFPETNRERTRAEAFVAGPAVGPVRSSERPLKPTERTSLADAAAAEVDASLEGALNEGHLIRRAFPVDSPITTVVSRAGDERNIENVSVPTSRVFVPAIGSSVATADVIPEIEPTTSQSDSGEVPFSTVRRGETTTSATLVATELDATESVGVAARIPVIEPRSTAPSRITFRGLNRVAANIAAPGTGTADIADSDDTESVKSFVSTEPESLMRRSPSLGIGVAKPAATMSDRFTPALNQHPASEYATVSATAGGVLAADATQAAPLPAELLAADAVNTAHRAVEVALRAADHVSSADRKSVDLQFSVGEADLNVRVELHANEVRTTFRTESPELRAALAHEWQSIAEAGTSGERSFRLAPATFVANDASTSNAFSGDASARDRQSNARRGENTRESAAAIGRTRASNSAGFLSSASAAIRPLVAAATSRHLHTLA